jgi:catechol 2,3-dioxygenase-like lactoylglutathione lyase family enzyme
MFARINHVAILSENNYALGRFYEGFFGLRPTGTKGPTRAPTVGDGVVGLNINPRLSGRPGRLDHFGIDVDSMDIVFTRIRERYPSVQWLARPSNRPFASTSAHDPDGNVFDISQKGMKNRDDLYSAESWQQERVVDHIALRTLNPEVVAGFYVDVFELKALNQAGNDGTFYLSDGRVTLVIMPWRIGDYKGMGISSPGLDHIGFKVESIAALQRDIDAVATKNYRFRPAPLGSGKEGAVRLALFRSSCPLGIHHLADPDGILLDVRE